MSARQQARLTDKPVAKSIGIFIFAATLIDISMTAYAADIERLSDNAELEAISNIVELNIEIEADIEDAWTMLGVHFDKSVAFNNAADHTFYLEQSERSVGSKRRTLSPDGKFVDVEIIEFSPAEHFIAWEIYATDVAPLKVAFSSYRLEQSENNRIILTQRAGFKLRNTVMDFVGKLQFHKLFIDELATIKFILETGGDKTSISKSKLKKQYYPAVTIKKYY